MKGLLSERERELSVSICLPDDDCVNQGLPDNPSPHHESADLPGQPSIRWWLCVFDSFFSLVGW